MLPAYDRTSTKLVQIYFDALFWCIYRDAHHFDAFVRSRVAGLQPYNRSCVFAIYFSIRFVFDHPIMTDTTAILALARQRQEHAGWPYAGAVTPAEAMALLSANPAIKLLDVRTQAERDWVGRVVIAESQHLAVQWSLYPGGAKNPDFIAQLEAVAGKDDVLLMLCRSGVRSRYAAEVATANGYRHCYDILEGFEGDRDSAGHRKTVGGWCQAGLPWIGA